VVTRETQIAALEPHSLRLRSSDQTQPGYRPCTDVEASIRDTYDALLDGLERLSAFADSGLFRETELSPYLSYWVGDISSSEGLVHDRRWRLSLLAYFHFYRFLGVQRLFARLGKDITIAGPVWQSLREADSDLATKLEQACQDANAFSA
jgi:hypothetical protein